MLSQRFVGVQKDLELFLNLVVALIFFYFFCFLSSLLFFLFFFWFIAATIPVSPTITPNPTKKPKDSGGSNGARIAGAVLLSLGACALVGGVGFLMYRRGKNTQRISSRFPNSLGQRLINEREAAAVAESPSLPPVSRSQVRTNTFL